MESIIGFASCLLCALPFFIIGVIDKNSSTPMPFWSGDQTLKEKVIYVSEYNRRMGKVYVKWGMGFFIAGLSCFLSIVVGIAALWIVCSVGTYLSYQSYKQILADCSIQEGEQEQKHNNKQILADCSIQEGK